MGPLAGLRQGFECGYISGIALNYFYPKSHGLAFDVSIRGFETRRVMKLLGSVGGFETRRVIKLLGSAESLSDRGNRGNP